MKSFVSKLVCWRTTDDDASSGDEIVDNDATKLSHVGTAVYDILRKDHHRHHRTLWNVTSGKVIGSVHQTPSGVWGSHSDPDDGHDNWFPAKMEELIARTEAWCDILSLGPPDGKFMAHFQAGLETLARRSESLEQPVVVRIMFGNIVGMPVDCSAVIKGLTKNLSEEAKLHLWVGAWRKGFTWNHAKIIAVDGVYLHTGGHNLWDAHYLSTNPVHDLSVELEGRIAMDGHRFVNQQWAFLEANQRTCVGCVVDAMPDYLPTVLKTRVTVSEYPEGVAGIFPPQFVRSKVAKTSHHSRLADRAGEVPLISIGRQGSLVHRHRPSDDAILAMINSSKTIIRMVLQDLGPVCIPGSKQAMPGLKWPKEYLAAIGRAIYQRGVDIEMVLSNPNSIPGGLTGTEANYGNGWDCIDVAAEIIKGIQKQNDVDDAKLRSMITENLRICFIRHNKKSTYADGKTIGLHSKHFIVDDLCCYIGSQNLYMCDLAEWGVVIDSEAEVKKIMNDYFNPLWENSYTGEDVDVEKVMDGLNVDRDGDQSKLKSVQSEGAAQQMTPHGALSEYYNTEKGFENNTVPAAIDDQGSKTDQSDEVTSEDNNTDNMDKREITTNNENQHSLEVINSKTEDVVKDNKVDPECTPEIDDTNNSSKEIITSAETSENTSFDKDKHQDNESPEKAPIARTQTDRSNDSKTAVDIPHQESAVKEATSPEDKHEVAKDDETYDESEVEESRKTSVDCNWCGLADTFSITK